MSDHEFVRDLLALSAAGLLEPVEERLVREHSRQCAACSAELDTYAALSAGLTALPSPAPPADLVRRTSLLLAAESDRRQGAFLAAAAAISTFVFVLLIGQTLRILEGDSAAMVWLAWASISSILGAAAALALATRRRLERSTT
jgi:predicted anti-sigma-YlaC factor YlaD